MPNKSLSPVVHDRTSQPWSRRRWISAVGATFVSTSIGCERSPTLTTDGGATPSTTLPTGEDSNPGRLPLYQAVHWLWLHGDRLAGWRSNNYAQLKSGPALTALVLRAVQQSQHDAWMCPAKWANAEDLLRKQVSTAGIVGADNPELLEYPNYATALTLSSLATLNVSQDKPLIERMRAYLVGQQYCEVTGFGPEHPAYGGWGFGGFRPLGDSPGHMDIAHTRHVLQALRAAGHDDPTTYERAERFLRLLQKHPTEDRPQPSSSHEVRPADWKCPYDGGFYFSPIVLPANKAGEDRHAGHPYFRSYATATCEGILALLACGVPRDDERIRAAAAWLEKHPRLDYPEGIPENTTENWAASIRFYHFAVRAECYAALNWPGEWRGELRTTLAKLQEPDGSFVNREGFLMKEDDPILCTALAVIALSQ